MALAALAVSGWYAAAYMAERETTPVVWTASTGYVTNVEVVTEDGKTKTVKVVKRKRVVGPGKTVVQSATVYRGGKTVYGPGQTILVAGPGVTHVRNVDRPVTVVRPVTVTKTKTETETETKTVTKVRTVRRTETVVRTVTDTVTDRITVTVELPPPAP